MPQGGSSCCQRVEGVPYAADRVDILDRSLVWLIGNDHPDATVVSPNGGEVITGNTIPVSWTEAPFGSATIAGRSIRYSVDGGWRVVGHGR